MTKYTHIFPVFLVAISIILLTGCGGSNSSGGTDSPSNDAPQNTCITPNNTVTIDATTYNFQQFTSSCVNIYFESNSNNQDLADHADELLDNLETSLNKINSQLEIDSIHYLINSNPTNIDPTSGIYTEVNSHNTVIVSIDYNLAGADDIDYHLADSALRARRIGQEQSSNRLIDALITEGLAIRFATEIADLTNPPDFAQAISDPDTLTSTQEQAQDNQYSTTYQFEDWFLGQGLLPENAGYTIGYDTVIRYLGQKPGSTAALAFGISADEFSKYLVQIDPEDPTEILKASVSVKTPDMDVPLPPSAEQVPIAVFNQQAAENIGMYFIEGHTNHKKIALSFDDGPSVGYTQQVLDILHHYNIKATFFVTGENLNRFPEIARAALEAGHTLANHSYAHSHNAGLSPENRWTQSIERTNQLFAEHLGFRPRLFRPPYGEISNEQVAFIYGKGMQTILWSMDTRDWYNTQEGGTQIIVDAVNTHMHEESIVLMHDAPQQRQNSVDALDDIIIHHLENGYEFVTIDKLIGVSPIL